MTAITHDEITAPGGVREVTDPRITWCKLHDFRMGRHEESIADHEARLRALERAAFRAAGMAAAAAVLGSVLAPVVMRAIGLAP